MAARRATTPPDLISAVDEAVKEMTWLTKSDQAMVALARKYAQTIENDPKTVGWVGPHLTNVLRALGGAPAERKELAAEKQVRGRLAELRRARKGS